MSKIKIQSIIIVIFFIIFSYFNIGEFLDYQKNHENLKNTEINNKEKISNFSLEKINNIKDIQLKVTPNNGVLKKIISRINKAKIRIYIEVYMFTNKDIISSVLKAKKRWVDIKVILEKNPYKIPNINNKTYNVFIKNKIDVVWSNSKNYSLNHSKMILIDNKIILSTWNLTHSTFIKNKDLFLFINDEKLLTNLELIFINDFRWIKTWEYNSNLVLSPNYSRKKLETLILSSRKEIKMYFPYIKDTNLEDLIIKKAKENIQIEIIVWKDFFNKYKEIVNKLKNAWIKINYLKKYTLHSKSILVDNTFLFIWSINFSYYSLDKNREIWLILKNKRIIKDFLKIFNNN